MSEWDNYDYVLKQIKINAINTYNCASKDFLNNKQILLEIMKYVYIQDQFRSINIIIPDYLKYDEEIYESYIYNLFKIPEYFMNSDNLNKKIISERDIFNNITKFDNYYYLITNINPGIDLSRELRLLKTQRKIKDDLYEFKNNLYELQNNFYKLKNDYYNFNNKLNKLQVLIPKQETLDILKNNYNLLINDIINLKNNFDKFKLYIIILLFIIIIFK